MALDASCRLAGCDMIFRGSRDFCLVSPRDLFRYGLLHNASFLIVVHNHPSGDSKPSIHDQEWTKQITELGRVLGMPVIDHLIITNNGYFSFAKSKCLESPGSGHTERGSLS